MDTNSSFLSRFLNYDHIIIQAHDNPDADALASGFGLYRFFTSHDIDTKLVYGGINQVTKPNLVLMLDRLDIPAEYVTELPECDLLITTDCQYGEGNVTRFEAPEVAIIDHHQADVVLDENCYIRSNLASCCTIVWDLLKKEGFPVSDDKDLMTALYYGLYSDSNAFAEMFHPLDRDMRDSLKKDDSLIFQLINTNLTMDELQVASRALMNQKFSRSSHFSVIEAEKCDPNILGIISDFVIQAEEIGTCVAYNPNPAGYKLSVRSCVREIKANELVSFLVEGVGNGGGHLNKAGGFISDDILRKVAPDKSIKDYLAERMKEYIDRYEIIHAADYDIDVSDMQMYEKVPVTVGYAKASNILRVGTPILIRTLEGDVDQIVEDDLYLMIGIEGEVYPIRRDKFERSYVLSDEEPVIVTDYPPVIKDTVYGNTYQLEEYMEPCVPTGEIKVYAKKLETPVKVFTNWDKEKYYRGEVGDYLVARSDDVHDIYIVRSTIFDRTYKEVDMSF